MSGLKLKVFNILCQTVDELYIENWGAAGIYFVQITNQNNTTSITKKMMINIK